MRVYITKKLYHLIDCTSVKTGKTFASILEIACRRLHKQGKLSDCDVFNDNIPANLYMPANSIIKSRNAKLPKGKTLTELRKELARMCYEALGKNS